MVRIPVGSGETFYKISKSDGVCEWRIFPAKSTAPKECAATKAKSKGFLLQECCCAGASGSLVQQKGTVPAIKIHSISLGDSGEEV